MHDHAFGMLWPIFWALFGLAFWLVTVILRHRARMKKLEMVRSLAEKGVAIPPELSAALAPEPRREPTPEGDVRAGLIMLAAAAGLAIMGTIIIFVMDRPAWPIYGAASFPALIGLVLLGLGMAKLKR
jgi:hypothetical protein